MTESDSVSLGRALQQLTDHQMGIDALKAQRVVDGPAIDHAAAQVAALARRTSWLTALKSRAATIFIFTPLGAIAGGAILTAVQHLHVHFH